MKKKWLVLYLCIFLMFPNVYGFKFVANKGFDFNKITEENIRNIYKLNIKWDDSGNKITLIHMSPFSDRYHIFIETFLQMSEQSYKNLIEINRSLGYNIDIRYASDEYNALELVRNTPYSIGYIGDNFYINRGYRHEIKLIKFNRSTTTN